jgi:hypothetical protein
MNHEGNENSQDDSKLSNRNRKISLLLRILNATSKPPLLILPTIIPAKKLVLRALHPISTEGNLPILAIIPNPNKMTKIVFGSILIQLKDNIAGVGRISSDAGIGVSCYVVDESIVDALDVGHVH